MPGVQSIHSAALIAQHLKVRAPAINSSRSIGALWSAILYYYQRDYSAQGKDILWKSMEISRI